MTVRPRGQSSDLLAEEDGHRGAVHTVPVGEGSTRAQPVPPAPVPAWLPRVPALGRCSVGRGSRASPCLTGGRTVASQCCHPPRSSSVVADSRPVEQRFPSRNRVPGRDKSRCNLLQLQVASAARAGAAGQSPRRDGAWGWVWKRKNLLENQPRGNGEASLVNGALQSRTPPSMTLRVSFQSPERVFRSAASAGSWEGPEGSCCSRIPELATGGTRWLHAPYTFILQKL